MRLTALLLALFPLVCHAEGGRLGDVAGYILSAVLVFCLAVSLWGVLAIAFFVLLRRWLSLGMRIVCTVLFYLAPVLLVGSGPLKAYAFGDSPRDVSETTREVMVVSGATFPAGSYAHYEVKGGFFGWRAQRRLLDISSPQPVALGVMQIERMTLDPEVRQIKVNLSVEQTLDGWLCAGGEYTLVDARPTGYVLHSCWLSEPRVWQGQTVPAGAYVSRNEDTGDWVFSDFPRPRQD